MSLKKYKERRNFNISPEPNGSKPKKKTQELIYVIQRHQASHLHYDLRLEEKGVLQSWAVPKEPPLEEGIKRLAVRTEDHPLGYEDFEGVIPEGQYGAGTVKIWDKGVYELKAWGEKMIEFTLKGEKLKGRYVLVPLKKAGKKNWLLLKGKDICSKRTRS